MQESMQVKLAALYHRQAFVVGIFFDRNPLLEKAVRRLTEVKWSQTHKCWYLPKSATVVQLVKKAFGGLAVVDDSYLVAHKQKEMLVQESLPEPKLPAARPKMELRLWKLSAENLAELKRFVDELKLKAYSPSTIRTYRNELIQLLQLLKQKPVVDLTAADLKRYMQYILEQGLSENSAHSRLNALKFYFEQVLKRERFTWEIPRAKKPQQLPKLLNETELARLFNAIRNKKHKAMLFTAYSAGLRVSEIVRLKLEDIDSKRMQIFVQRSKGKKDRYVNLSPVLLDILRKYLLEYKPQPKEYLFESEQSGCAYPVRTIQQIFTNAKRKAGIRKDVGIHSLRHSFATHLLDKGTDIRYIKDLLGHFNIRTTERYLHVSKKQLVNIVSPFDDLWKNSNLDW